MCGSLLTNTGLFRTNRMAMQFNVGRQMACMVPQTRVTRRTSGSDGWMRPAPDFIAGVRKSDHSIGSGHRSRLACTCAAPFLHPQGTRWCLELAYARTEEAMPDDTWAHTSGLGLQTELKDGEGEKDQNWRLVLCLETKSRMACLTNMSLHASHLGPLAKFPKEQLASPQGAVSPHSVHMGLLLVSCQPVSLSWEQQLVSRAGARDE
ncbi:hypothetical protein B0T24DRAFT_594524 [Lasiosphaeria ovina]|uniref:Uncharacterized protein n=1 Tax=Lasiosphaeria ovina TaxID=92902 RepID=A0AAE0N8S0_9PEZI|nr:hypothetical protein B0T24DRAFT_594524 [Lasiosphaeria ovina]